MALNLDIHKPALQKPRITIFGVGGAGGNAINNMIRAELEGVEFVAANTDAQALENSLAANKIQLGAATTKGLGAGSFPDRGRAAAEENVDEIVSLLEGSNMVFIAAGMGGGTGTGAAPVIAKLARERDILTVGVVTKPFHFEGKYRMETAQKGIDDLKKHVDTLIVIPNQNLFRIANEHTTFESAFKMADDVLHAGVRGITDLITMPGLVNLDFADIRTIMTKMGKAMMGTGEAEGENRAIEACEAAISNPLLDDISIRGAKGVLVNMTGGPDMTLFEADLAVNAIRREVDNNANIIFGSAFNENMKGKIRISVVATGIDEDEYRQDSLRTEEIQEPAKVGKNFFDPGIVEEVAIEIIEEIDAQNFKPKKSATKYEEEIKSEPKIEVVIEPREEKMQHEILEEEDDSFSQVRFFVEEELEDEEEEKPAKNKKHAPKSSTNKVSHKEKPSEKLRKEAKEKESGFSLFGFMNSSKPKKAKVEEEEDYYEEEANHHTKKKSETSERLAKKRQEFFGATVFDEEKPQTEERLDDDIINVPAFFRRKTK